MVLKRVSAVIMCTMLLTWSGGATADQYRADQFLGLDLSKAVLSPKRLGPVAEFAPVPVEAKADRGAEHIAYPKIHAAKLRSEKRHTVVHSRLARHHGNPLDAQAFDMRIQVWPCKSGGICDWKRPVN